MKSKTKESKYKAFNITNDELGAIYNGLEQMSACIENGCNEEMENFYNEQIVLIQQFRKKIKIQ